MKKLFIGLFLLVFISLFFFTKRQVFAQTFDLDLTNVSVCYNSCRYDPVSTCDICDVRLGYQIVNHGPDDYNNAAPLAYTDMMSWTYTDWYSGYPGFGAWTGMQPIVSGGTLNNVYETAVYVCSGITYQGYVFLAGRTGTDTNPANNIRNMGSLIACPSAPTATPTPLLSCPYTLQQTTDSGSVNLGLGYSDANSTPFTSPITAGVNRIDIFAGKHVIAGAQVRQITCEVRNGASVLGEATTAALDAASSWRTLSFPGVMSLNSGTTYSIYCKQTSGTGFQTYWTLNSSSGIKTYKVYLNQCAPTPTSTPTTRPTSTVTPRPTATTAPTAGPTPTGGVTPTPTGVVPTPTPFCSTYYWQVQAYNGTRTRLSGVRSFQVCLGANRWFQAKDGDIHAEGSITSIVPGTVAAADRYLILDGAGGSPGIASYKDNLDFGTNGGLSTLNWQAKKLYLGIDIGFEYLKNRLNVDENNTFSGSIPIPTGVEGVYYSPSGVNLSGSFPAGKKIALFVNGDVTVNNNIVVPVGSFFALISSGKITFVGGDTPVTKAQGFFLADQTISTTLAAQQFEGQGSFVGKLGINLQRDLGNTNNKTTAADFFISRPDFFVNAPQQFLITPSFFQEVAP